MIWGTNNHFIRQGYTFLCRSSATGQQTIRNRLAITYTLQTTSQWASRKNEPHGKTTDSENMSRSNNTWPEFWKRPDGGYCDYDNSSYETGSRFDLQILDNNTQILVSNNSCLWKARSNTCSCHPPTIHTKIVPAGMGGMIIESIKPRWK